MGKVERRVFENQIFFFVHQVRNDFKEFLLLYRVEATLDVKLGEVERREILAINARELGFEVLDAGVNVVESKRRRSQVFNMTSLHISTVNTTSVSIQN